MNHSIFNLISSFYYSTKKYNISGLSLTQIERIGFLVTELETNKYSANNLFDELKKQFIMLVIYISNDKTIPSEMIINYSNVIVEIFDSEKENISELVNLFNELNVNPSFQEQFSSLQI